MIIGIDFDNTIADYTGVFYRVGCALSWLPESVGQSKNEVKQYFIEHGQERKWTELQGIVYGKEIEQAKPYKGCLYTLKTLYNRGHQLKLVSHKTKYPIIGEKVNFHDAATHWLISNGFIEQQGGPFTLQDLFFNETKENKINCINHLQCDVFIDDLESIFNHPNFPNKCKVLLFNSLQQDPRLQRVEHWDEVHRLL